MTAFVHPIGDCTVTLWGLLPRQRLRHQVERLPDMAWTERLEDVPDQARLLVIRTDYVIDAQALGQLSQRNGLLLRCPDDGRFAAAVVDIAQAQQALALLGGESEALPENLNIIEPADLHGYDRHLRRARPPLLKPVSPARQKELEDLLYGNAYKGITDLVTKWIWPRPAKRAVRWLAAAGATPNMVTGAGVALMVAAGYLFMQGDLAWGLAAAWLMTFLDTVDGKLARVTVQSSRLGHVLDHGMDILHPPFWYILWGASLGAITPFAGLGLVDFYWVIGIGYLLGRVAEALFHLLGDCGIFSWRPFDAYFRLVTARRNPCLIILTIGAVAGRADLGFLAVALWTAATTAVLWLRLGYAAWVRTRRGPLRSWLADPAWAQRRHERAYQTFSATQGAYNRI
ncbi:MAG: CDP-alcohol phosphatidyltransferase family protein [Pseudomonadota bacterium]